MADETIRKRPTAARIGVSALNLLLPGVGLIRLGEAREGFWIIGLFMLACGLFGLFALMPPDWSFATGVVVVGLFLLMSLALVLFSIGRTWAKSRSTFGTRWWSRWYSILIWTVLGSIGTDWLMGFYERSYHTFYIASVSMAPTFTKNEKIVADMRWRTPRIGNILMVLDKDGVTRIYRVAATGGQTFAMRNGVPIIDGHPATQAYAGEMTIADTGMDEESGRRMHEHFPGETGSHDILQLSGYPQDDVAPVRIPAGSLYLLGDDRDLSADSRIPFSLNGIGIVPISAIIGRPLYIAWSKDRSRIGQRADH